LKLAAATAAAVKVHWFLCSLFADLVKDIGTIHSDNADFQVIYGWEGYSNEFHPKVGKSHAFFGKICPLKGWSQSTLVEKACGGQVTLPR